MQLYVTNKPDASDIEFIRMKIRAFSQMHVDCGDIQELAIFSRNEKNKLTGGLFALTWGNWIEIKLLWIEESLRLTGIGSQLLLKAEQEAKNRGCRFSTVDTFSFQAKGFYLGKGYQIEMTLTDFPINQQRYYFIKKL